jgi:hypothetical protein
MYISFSPQLCTAGKAGVVLFAAQSGFKNRHVEIALFSFIVFLLSDIAPDYQFISPYD